MAAFVGLVVFAVSGPAGAKTTTESTVDLTGGLTIAWQGDQSRGCAAAGVCGVSGSLEIAPNGLSSYGGVSGRLVEISDLGAVARVIDIEGTSRTSCVDPVPTDVTFAVRHSGSGGLVAVFSPDRSNQPPSSGRCAGPTVADLASALTLPARKIGRASFDLSGRRTATAGHFDVTVISTLRAITRTRGSGLLTNETSVTISGSAGAGSFQQPRLESAQVMYRVTGTAGSLTQPFGALPSPACDPLGACGSAGTLTEALSGATGVTFSGERTVRRRIGRRAALRDLRRGKLNAGGAFIGPVTITVGESIGNTAGLHCAGSTTSRQFLAQPFTTHRVIDFALFGSAAEDFAFGGGADPFRTECAGPSATDLLGTSALAHAAIPVGSVGAPHLTITFRSSGSFTGSTYASSRGGQITVSLVRVHEGGGTSGSSSSRIPSP